jgi:glycerol-3-phosphate acyltransferase PlsY
MTAWVVSVLSGYLIGSVPFGLLLTRAAGLPDIRGIGSGNIGATNVLRTGRRGLAAATLVLDAGKALLAVVVARWWLGPFCGDLAGLAAVLGHVFPVWLGFRGGKGVATGFGMLFGVTWPAGAVAAAVWVAMAAAFRMSSLAALTACAAAPVAAFWFGGRAAGAVALAAGAVVVARHEANIRRIVAGTEGRF